jgi:hypothetical protein
MTPSILNLLEILSGSRSTVGYKKFAATAIGAVLMGSVAFASISFADGMEKPPAPATPLDKAIDQIQNKEPPVSVTPPAEPVIEQTPPPAPLPPAPPARIVEVQPETSFFGLSIGAYNPDQRGKMGVAFNLEWQPGVKIVGILQPLFGAMVTTRGSTMAYGGLGTPFHITKHVFLMPSFSVGAYGRGDGKNLGQVLAFRAAAELAYEFEDKSRIGLSFAGIGNGDSMQKKDRTEVISLVYTIPLNLFSGKPRISSAVSAPPVAAAPVAPAPVMAPAGAPVADTAVDQSLKK